MKIARGLKKNGDGRFTCTSGSLQRHFKVILRFVTRTDAVIFITRKGKNDLVLMSYKHYMRLSGELEDVKHALERILDSGVNS